MSQEERLEEIINILYDDINRLALENCSLRKEKTILSNAVDKLETEKQQIKQELDTLSKYTGYMRKNMRFFSDEAILRLMYTMYLDGNSFNKISIYLNENKIPTRKGGVWSKSSVLFILKNTSNIKKILNEEEKNKFYSLILKNTRNNNNVTKK